MVLDALGGGKKKKKNEKKSGRENGDLAENEKK